jgi:hypothetical protein
MQRVLACLAHPRMSARDSHTLPLTPPAPLLPPCETALLLPQVPQASLIVPGVLDLLPCGEDRQVCKPEVYSYQVSCAWEQGAGNLGAEAHVVRPPRIPRLTMSGRSTSGSPSASFRTPSLGSCRTRERQPVPTS